MKDETKDLLSMMRTRTRIILANAEQGDFKSAKAHTKTMLRWLGKAEDGVFMKYKRRES